VLEPVPRPSTPTAALVNDPFVEESTDGKTGGERKPMERVSAGVEKSPTVAKASAHGERARAGEKRARAGGERKHVDAMERRCRDEAARTEEAHLAS
jgi:hypothetical protein